MGDLTVEKLISSIENADLERIELLIDVLEVCFLSLACRVHVAGLLHSSPHVSCTYASASSPPPESRIRRHIAARRVTTRVGWVHGGGGLSPKGARLLLDWCIWARGGGGA